MYSVYDSCLLSNGCDFPGKALARIWPGVPSVDAAIMHCNPTGFPKHSNLLEYPEWFPGSCPVHLERLDTLRTAMVYKKQNDMICRYSSWCGRVSIQRGFRGAKCGTKGLALQAA